MKIEQTTTKTGFLFTIEGAISRTDDSAGDFFESVTLALNQKPQEIVLDMEKTTRLDSISIGMLVGILLNCKEFKTAFRIQNISPQVRVILESTNLKRVFPELY